MKNVVVESCQFEIYENGLLNVNGIVAVHSSSVASTNSKVDGKGIYTTLNVTVSGFTSSSVSGWISGTGSTTTPLGVVVPGQIVASALYNKVDGDAIFLEGDTAENVTIYGKKQEGEYVVDATTTVTIKVKSAGQTAVKAE